MAGNKDQTSSEDFYTDLPVGEILRRARLQTGQSIPEVERYLRIRASHLEALEQSDFDALPGRVYVIGFVRTYAEYLNLDGARVVGLLKRQSRGLTTPQAMNFYIPASESHLPGWPVLAASFAGLVIVLLLWGAYQSTRLSGAEALPPTPAEIQSLSALEKLANPVAAPATPNGAMSVAAATATSPIKATPAPAPVVPAIEIRLLDESWIELRNPEGRVVDARLYRKGETMTFEKPVDEFGNAYTITTGNAAALQVLVAGKPMPALGGVNKVRRNVPLDPKTLGALMPQ